MNTGHIVLLSIIIALIALILSIKDEYKITIKNYNLPLSINQTVYFLYGSKLREAIIYKIEIEGDNIEYHTQDKHNNKYIRTIDNIVLNKEDACKLIKFDE